MGLVRQRTRVRLILDVSGSMRSVKEDVIRSHNDYVDWLRSQPNEIRYGSVAFNEEVRVLTEDLPLMHVPDLNHENYVPDGGTALYDAVCQVIHETEAAIAPGALDRVFVVIITDGDDTSSTTTLAETKKLIEAKEATGRWHFLFLGADVKTGTRMGVRKSFRLGTGGAGIEAAFAQIEGETRQLLLTDGSSPIAL